METKWTGTTRLREPVLTRVERGAPVHTCLVYLCVRGHLLHIVMAVEVQETPDLSGFFFFF